MHWWHSNNAVGQAIVYKNRTLHLKKFILMITVVRKHFCAAGLIQETADKDVTSRSVRLRIGSRPDGCDEFRDHHQNHS